MTALVIAHRSQMVNLDGEQVHVKRGRTIAVADHRIVTDNPDLWRDLVVDFDTEEGGAPARENVARPTHNSRKADWAAYALSLGVPGDVVDGMSKEDLIAECEAVEAGTEG